jgi:hypothetical protein
MCMSLRVTLCMSLRMTLRHVRGKMLTAGIVTIVTMWP